MKRSLMLMLLIGWMSTSIVAQTKKSSAPAQKPDVIITIASEKIDAFITEVSDETISYRKANNPTGPVFVLSTDKVSSILYANGDIQVIKHQPAEQVASQPSPSTPTQSVAQTPPTYTSPAPQTYRDTPINTRAPQTTSHPKEETQDISLGIHGDITGTVGGFGEGQKVGGGIGGDLEVGFLTSNERNFLGAGVSVDAVFTTDVETDKGKATTTYLYLPIYACDKFYFTTNPTAPYLDLALGGFVNLKTATNYKNWRVKDEEQKGKGGGLFFRAGLGVAIATNHTIVVHLNLGYELLYSKTKVEGTEFESKLHSIYFRIGIGTR